MHQLALSALTHGRLYNSLDTTFGWHMNLVFITFSSITLSLGFDIGAPSCWQQHSMCDTVSDVEGKELVHEVALEMTKAHWYGITARIDGEESNYVYIMERPTYKPAPNEEGWQRTGSIITSPVLRVMPHAAGGRTQEQRSR